MKEYEDWIPKTTKSQPLERTDLLLSQLAMYLRMGWVPEDQTLEQRAALKRAKGALDTYVSFFYEEGNRRWGDFSG